MYTKPIAGEAALKLLGRLFDGLFNGYTKPIAGEAALKPFQSIWGSLARLYTKPIAGEAALKPFKANSIKVDGKILNPLQAKQH